jgi:hypothetical protein
MKEEKIKKILVSSHHPKESDRMKEEKVRLEI